MDRLAIIESFIYSTGQIALGLFLHPYKTMQSLLRDQVFLFFVFLPTFLAVFFYLLFGSLALQVFYGDVLFFRLIYRAIFFFFLMWQAILFYLWRRFYRAFRL